MEIQIKDSKLTVIQTLDLDYIHFNLKRYSFYLWNTGLVTLSNIYYEPSFTCTHLNPNIIISLPFVIRGF